MLFTSVRDLSSNQLSGSIPISFGSLTLLREFTVATNNFDCMDALPKAVNFSICGTNSNPWDCGSSCCNWWNVNKQWQTICGPLPCPNANSTAFCELILQLNLNTGIAEVTTLVEVEGNLIVPSTSILEVTPHGAINVTGCLSFEGGLVIDLQHQHLENNTQLSLIEASCFIGNGTASTLSITNVNHCQKVTSTSQAIDNGILIAFIISSNTCSDTTVIAGAVAGGVAAVLVIAVIVTVMMVPSLKKQFLPFLMTKEERKKSKE